MKRITYSFHYRLLSLCVLVSFACPVAQPQNVTLHWPGTPEGQSKPASTPSAKPTEPKQPLKSPARPTDGSVSGNIYTNDFFGFSLPVPQTWKILPNDSAPLARATGTAYFLFWAGALVGETRAPRSIAIVAFQPSPNTAEMTTEQYAEHGTASLNALASVYPEVAKNMGPFKLVSIGGRQLAQSQVVLPKNDATKNDSQIIWLAMSDRGYFLMFLCLDPSGRQSDPDAAARAINSLHFLGEPN